MLKLKEAAAICGVTVQSLGDSLRRGTLKGELRIVDGVSLWHISRTELNVYIARRNRIVPQAEVVERNRAAEAARRRHHVIADLHRHIGVEATVRLCEVFGGQRIWVPISSSEKLIRALGESTAEALCAVWGGDYFQVPLNAMGLGKAGVSHTRIAELHRQGCKINDIAREVGCSRRTVFRHLNLPANGRKKESAEDRWNQWR